MNWKLSDETKTGSGKVCRKAMSQRIGSRMMMNMDNGKMNERDCWILKYCCMVHY
jgi:hypothetical protein